MCHQRLLAVRAVYWNSFLKEADDTCFPAVCPVFIRRLIPHVSSLQKGCVWCPSAVSIFRLLS